MALAQHRRTALTLICQLQLVAACQEAMLKCSSSCAVMSSVRGALGGFLQDMEVDSQHRLPLSRASSSYTAGTGWSAACLWHRGLVPAMFPHPGTCCAGLTSCL